MNYGKRRLLILTKEQRKQGYVKTKHIVNRQKKLKFTVKQWKRFDINKQMYLCKLYQVILLDYKIKWRNRKLRSHSPVPLKEKVKTGIKNLPDKMTQENLQKGIDVVQKGINDFSKGMNEFSVLNGPEKDFSILDNSKKDYSFLVGKDSKRKKNHKPKTIKKDYSFLINKNGVKVF